MRGVLFSYQSWFVECKGELGKEKIFQKPLADHRHLLSICCFKQCFSKSFAFFLFSFRLHAALDFSFFNARPAPVFHQPFGPMILRRALNPHPSQRSFY